MVRRSEALEGGTAFLATAVAGLLLVVPLSFGRSCHCTPYQVNRLVLSVPREAAIGVLVAAVTAVVAVSLARSRTAWWIALGATLLLLITHTIEAHSASPDILITAAYLDAIGSGILLGATGVAVLGRRVPATGFVLGGVGCFVVITLSQASGLLGNPHRATSEPHVWSVFGTQPLWLLAAVVVLILACQLVTRQRFTLEPIYPELPLSPVIAAIVLVMSELAVAQWRFRHGDGGVELLVTALCTLLATTVAAWLLPRRDGITIYLAVALSAAGSAVGSGPRPAWSVPLLLGLIVLGYLAGIRTWNPPAEPDRRIRWSAQYCSRVSRCSPPWPQPTTCAPSPPPHLPSSRDIARPSSSHEPRAASSRSRSCGGRPPWRRAGPNLSTGRWFRHGTSATGDRSPWSPGRVGLRSPSRSGVRSASSSAPSHGTSPRAEPSRLPSRNAA
ncbi:hypothetical protein [Nocardia asiatica]|uniref:hypothetical protein n=1 Tax=Nocardia asiatica TaxID=209252 RepID=UPI0024537507|nr:hypothetical protein [Nocardia asiatica]